MGRKTFVLFCWSASIILSGCAGFPHLAHAPYVDVTEIVRSIECELSTATSALRTEYEAPGERYWLLDVVVDIQLDLTTKLTSNAGGSVGVRFPVDTGIGDVGLGAGRKDINEGTGKLIFQSYLEDLGLCTPRATRSVLTGDVGAGQWLHRTASAMGEIGSKAKQMEYSVSFEMTLNANGGVTISAVPFDHGATIGGSIGLTGGERLRRHKLLLTFNYVPPAAVAAAPKQGRSGGKPKAPRKSVDSPQVQDAIRDTKTLFLLQGLTRELEDEADEDR